jgi:Fe-S-cluster-containing dehydrogenase component
MACPYNVRYLNAEEKVVEKCTLCEQKTAEGELPQCVTQCGARAKFFGDIDAGIDSLECPGDYLALGNDHSYNATKNTRYVLGERVKSYSNSDVYRLPDVGNAPSFAYILRNYKWQGNA